MARSNKGISGFDQVATQNNNTNNKNSAEFEQIKSLTEYQYQEEQQQEQEEKQESDLVYDLLNRKQKPKKKEWRLTGFYLDDDILAVMDRLLKNSKRGDKNKLGNDAFREYFKNRGLL